MGNFLVVGTGPLLAPGSREFSGQCLRTWHFSKPLLAAGHSITLVTVPIPGATPAQSSSDSEQLEYLGQTYESFLVNAQERILPRLRDILAKGRFDAALGINAYPAYLLALCQPKIPFWADLNGWTMAEGQTRAAIVGNDDDLEHFWRMEATTLLAADRFSAVSQRQADALVGELAVLGRLNRHTFQTSFASTVPNAVYPDYARLVRGEPRPACIEALVPDSAHIVLWSGGFNTWTDVPTLTRALSIAFAGNPHIHFVATGGAVTGHDDHTFREFQRAIGHILPTDRTHLLGWIGASDVLALHSCAHVGISLDTINTETRYGARNRLTNMLGCGLPVLTTRGTEIAEWIEANHAGEVVAPGCHAELANAILRSRSEHAAWEDRARRAWHLAQHSFAPETTLKEFLHWAGEPSPSPDRAVGSENRVRARASEWVNFQGSPSALLAEREALLADRENLRRLRDKWPIKLWRKIKSFGK